MANVCACMYWKNYRILFFSRCVPTWEWKHLLRIPCKCMGCFEWPQYYTCFTGQKVNTDEDDLDETAPLANGNGQSGKSYQAIRMDAEDQRTQTGTYM